MLKNKGKTCMVQEPSHVKQLSLNHVCKIGLTEQSSQSYKIPKMKPPFQAQNFPSVVNIKRDIADASTL
jgi:hypothetical protein